MGPPRTVTGAEPVRSGQWLRWLLTGRDSAGTWLPDSSPHKGCRGPGVPSGSGLDAFALRMTMVSVPFFL